MGCFSVFVIGGVFVGREVFTGDVTVGTVPVLVCPKQEQLTSADTPEQERG